AAKNRAVKQARGILQITPESLEALLMRRTGDLQRLFGDLRFIIIDELHAMMGLDRGLQVICQINRIEQITGNNPRRIGLSATLNDYAPAERFLADGSNRKVKTVGFTSTKKIISIAVENFTLPEDELRHSAVWEKHNRFIYDYCKQKKCLIFTNSRGDSEKIIVALKKIAASQNEDDIFFVHHGSVSADLRQSAELALRENTSPTVAAATLTLELGIDIGDLDSTVQLGSPYTSASFVQRLGRSGRRTGKSQMLFVNVHENIGDSPFDLPWNLLRSIAIIELYIKEKWVEPCEIKPKPFSLLAHQTLSTLTAKNELTALQLKNAVLTLPPFANTITADEYKILLRHMLDKGYIERLDSGTLIIGVNGEKLVNHYSFYAVFKVEDTYQVQSQEGKVGELDICPVVDETFVLAGRSWIVLSIDEERKIIFVNPVKSSRIPIWKGFGGSVHTKIVRKINQILQEDTNYKYLSENAADLLEKSRRNACESGILQNNFVQYSKNGFYFCPWVGSKQLKTIEYLLSTVLKEELEIFSVSKRSGYHLQFTSNLPKAAFSQYLQNLQNFSIFSISEEILAENFAEKSPPKLDKYDYMIPDELLKQAFLLNELDLPNATKILAKMR
ncbi:MAG: DEAD/DEAH box helicase, partial [Firmicutes bacterium]|nr:DEAD/DEAH box helicase [Bacillota bacterium]